MSHNSNFKTLLKRLKKSQIKKDKFSKKKNFSRASSQKRLTKKIIINKSKVRTPDGKNAKNLSSIEQEIRSELIYKEHLFMTFQALKIIRNMESIDAGTLMSKRVYLPRRKGYEDKKTVIFDLDETLVHCCDEDPDFILRFKLPSGELVDAGLNIRPYALECLEFASKHFEVIVFTASQQFYADRVLDYIDPKRKLIHHRLYRDNCIPSGKFFLKDLRIFDGRSLKDTVIVDNSVFSFANHLDNGIPIISWKDDYNDKELLNLMDYLKVLADTRDVRTVNRNAFKLHNFYEDYIDEMMTSSENTSHV